MTTKIFVPTLRVPRKEKNFFFIINVRNYQSRGCIESLKPPTLCCELFLVSETITKRINIVYHRPSISFTAILNNKNRILDLFIMIQLTSLKRVKEKLIRGSIIILEWS